jgi:hypothetical protein
MMTSEVLMQSNKEGVKMLDSEEIDRQITRYVNLIETEIGEDIIPITIIMLCRLMTKYNLDLDWTVSTIIMGYRNESPPLMQSDVTKYDS